MAGSYPDAPGERMAWDEDGTVAWYCNIPVGVPLVYLNMDLTTLTEWSLTNRQKLNDEDATVSYPQEILGYDSFSGGLGSYAFGWVFPELRDIDGFFPYYRTGSLDASSHVGQYPPAGSLIFLPQYSVDSTNGITGTWVDFALDEPTYLIVDGDFGYRFQYTPLSLTGVRSIRVIIAGSGFINHVTSIRLFHIYGNIATGSTPDRLLFIDNDTGLEFTEPQDWGDVPRGTTLTHDIKIKNNSATLTANTVLLDFEDLTGDSADWHTLSDSGGAYGNTLPITSIAPTASYPAANVITVKLTVADDENLGLNASRLQASTTSWT